MEYNTTYNKIQKAIKNDDKHKDIYVSLKKIFHYIDTIFIYATFNCECGNNDLIYIDDFKYLDQLKTDIDILTTNIDNIKFKINEFKHNCSNILLNDDLTNNNVCIMMNEILNEIIKFNNFITIII